MCGPKLPDGEEGGVPEDPGALGEEPMLALPPPPVLVLPEGAAAGAPDPPLADPGDVGGLSGSVEGDAPPPAMS